MAGSSTNISLILPVVTDATIVRDIYNLNWNTIDGRFSATYMAVQAKASVSITGGSITGITDLTIADGGTGSSTAANARTALGLAIGTDVQAYDAGVLSIAALTTAANKMIYTTALDTYAITALTAFGRSIIDDANEAAFKATVNLEIGTDVQAYDAQLADIAALAVTNSNFIVGDGTNWVAESGATARTSLGLAIGTNVQAYDASLSSIAALTYASGSFIALTAEDTYAVRTYAQTLTDIGAAASGANTDITSLGGITGAIATATTISMTAELDMTGALACIDLNPAWQTTKDIISLIPTATINATQVWRGFYLDGSALDPNGVDVEITGAFIDFSGVSEANSPMIHAFKANVPFGQDALHILEGQLHIDTVLPSTAASEFTTLDIVIDSSALVSTSEYHAIDVATTGTPSGYVVALGTHSGIDVIHQHIGTFTTPSQTEFAGVKHTGGDTWVDGIDAYGVIFAAVNDAIYVGSAAKFAEIEVIMTTGGTKSIAPTFWYNTAADTWTQFFPADDTDGFQQSGEIRWELSSITATWTGDGDPGGVDTTAGYWIKIVRTRVGTVGSPDPATVKTGTVVEYSWDKLGDITVKSLILTTPLGAAYGGTGIANNAASTLTITGNYTLGLTLSANTAVTLPTSGTLITTAVATLSSLTSVGTITTGGLGTGAVLAGVTMTLGSDVDGDIYYRASNVLTRLAKGTATQVLAMNSGATAPEWVAAGAGGGDTLPVVDTTGIAKGSVDVTKIVRLEVDGLTTSTTRVLTVQDKDGTIADTADVALKSNIASPTFTTQITTPIIALTGGQIAFPASAAPSAGANTLDDYEEGEWTIGVSFGGGTTGITYGDQKGYYTKIGNLVSVSGLCGLSSKGSSTGVVLITGLPFTVVNDTAANSGAALFLNQITFANQYSGFFVNNSTTVIVYETLEDGTVTQLTNADFVDTSNFRIGGTYRI